MPTSQRRDTVGTSPAVTPAPPGPPGAAAGVVAVFAPLKQRLQARAALTRSLAAAVADSRAAEVGTLQQQLTVLQTELPALNRQLRQAAPTLAPGLVAELRAVTAAAGAADAELRAALDRSGAESLDAWLLARGRATEAGLDQLLAGTWDREIDLLVLVGPGSRELIARLRERGQRRIFSLDPTRPQTSVAEGADPPAVGNYHTPEILDAAVMLIPFPHPSQARTIAVGGFPVDGVGEIVSRLRRTLQTVTEASNELEEAVPFFAQTSVRNLVHIAEQASIAPLRGALAGLPAVVVSAGPSLDRNIDQLRGREGQVVIIAINQTVRALRKAGIRADLVVVVDPMKVTYHFEGVAPGELGTLVLGASVDPSLFSLPARRVLSFAASPLSESWIYELCGEDASAGSGGTVATAALKLAAWLGCSPIVSIGRDLALDGQRYYADGSADGGQAVELTADGSKISFASYSSKLRLAENGGNAEEVKALLAAQVYELSSVPGFFGKPVTTTSLFLYEMDLLREVVRKLSPPAVFQNATEGGAFLEGMEHLPLGEALARCTSQGREPFEVDALLGRRLAGIDFSARRERLLGGLRELVADLAATVALARQAAQRVEGGGDARQSRRREKLLARTRRQLAAQSRSRLLISMLVQRATRAITRKQIGKWSTLAEVAEAEQALYQAIEGTVGELARGIENKLPELAAASAPDRNEVSP